MLISDRFDINPLRNEITDMQTGKVNRVEPRLMKLLCLLAEHKEKVVSREIIVKEIWNDYPGGDEGLNQAISVLRKLLDDSQKQTIETLSKTGYCFHGAIAAEPVICDQKSFKVFYLLAASFLLLIAMLILIYHGIRGNDKVVVHKLSHDESVRAFKMDAGGRTDSKQVGQSGKPDDGRKAGSPVKTDDGRNAEIPAK